MRFCRSRDGRKFLWCYEARNHFRSESSRCARSSFLLFFVFCFFLSHDDEGEICGAAFLSSTITINIYIAALYYTTLFSSDFIRRSQVRNFSRKGCFCFYELSDERVRTSSRVSRSRVLGSYCSRVPQILYRVSPSARGSSSDSGISTRRSGP